MSFGGVFLTGFLHFASKKKALKASKKKTSKEEVLYEETLSL